MKPDNKNKSIDIDSLCKQIKVMRPGAVMQFIAKQFGMKSTQFVAKHALDIAKSAIKNGWVKTKDIGSSIADFSKKNKEDTTDIDFSNIEIDPSTTSFKCIFDNLDGKLSEFMNEFESELKDEAKEIEKADKQLHADVKKAGVDMDSKQIDDNGIVVASVIDNKKNKGKSGKELKKTIENEIQKDENVKELKKISANLEKSSSKIKVDKKYEKMSDEQFAKLDDEVNKKIRNKSNLSSKSNDAFRNKIKNAIQKGVAEEFKKSVKTIYVSTDKLKKSIATNMKSGLAVEQIKEPRSVCISVQVLKKNFKNVLKESKGSPKIIDVTNGSKNKSIQKVIDYIKKILQDKIGKDKLGDKIYAYLKNAGGNCLLYVFAGVKQDELNEAFSFTVDGKAANPKLYVGQTKIGNLLKDLGSNDSKLRAIFGGKSATARNAALMRISTQLSGFNVRYEQDPDKAIKTLLAGAKTTEQKDALAELATKLRPDCAGKFKNLGIDINGQIDKIANKAKDVANTAKEVATQAKDAKNIATSAVEQSIDAGIDDGPSEQFGKVKTGFAMLSNGKAIPAFSYQTMSRQITKLDNIFDDGVVDKAEMIKLASMGTKIDEYAKWATQNANSDDPMIQQKIAQIKNLTSKYHSVLADHNDVLDKTTELSDARSGATEATRAASKELANDEEVKQAAGGWKDKLGLNKAFTALGWARLAAKSTAIILNNGKAVVDSLGSIALKFKEDSNVIAQMNFLVTNGDKNDSKFKDTKFSVRFSTDDFKWHATCLDDRKMKFDEDSLIKKALESNEGKKFKAACLNKWTNIFKPKDTTRNILPYIMKNFDKLGLKASDSNVKKVTDTISKMEDNFDKIKTQFK